MPEIRQIRHSDKGSRMARIFGTIKMALLKPCLSVGEVWFGGGAIFVVPEIWVIPEPEKKRARTPPESGPGHRQGHGGGPPGREGPGGPSREGGTWGPPPYRSYSTTGRWGPHVRRIFHLNAPPNSMTFVLFLGSRPIFCSKPLKTPFKTPI